MKMPSWFDRVKWPESAPKSVLAAVSGGPDSVALAVLLASKGLLGGIAHVNYHLRDEADLEAELVERLALSLKVPFFLHEGHFPADTKISTQLWARELRYSFFSQVLEHYGLTSCALGHHRDDQIETVLLNLLRSHSDRPFAGIPFQREAYVRPLLDISKQELVAFLEANAVSYAIDPTNLESEYLRNQVRNDILPVLEAVNPSIGERILELHQDGEVLYRYLDHTCEDLAASVTGSGIEGEHWLDERKLAQMAPQFPKSIFLSWWGRRIGLTGLEIRILQAYEPSPKDAKWMMGAGELHYKQGKWIFLENGFIDIVPFSMQADAVPFLVSAGALGVVEGQAAEFQDDFARPGWQAMDLQRVRFPLIIRPPRQGDKMQPLGLYGSKSVKKILSEMGLLPRHALVVEDAHGHIIYVKGYRISELVKIHEQTEAILYLRAL